ncbi:mitochondrial ribosomal protein-like protein subunit L7 [Ascodesmis nigricans]|uniref:Large ribosomal subunit protein uL5m n=1 Tax=Ascodesmis nigricans TaxID=341454 RepID=A0A4S2N4P2_9PEZI|nr:mitochondrial ribosomal protein-like protein subunit L7 [Ascodesmis nigricans]
MRKISASSPSKTATRTRARYQFRPPRYYRGPLHPVQPPRPSEPNSREFVPGPFGRERLEDHFHNTIASDMMILSYTHLPPGVPRKKVDIKDRLREWDDSSPYHKNRPLKGPKGGSVLRLMDKPGTFHNVPKLTGVTVHSMVKGALQDQNWITSTRMIVQSVTGLRAEVVEAKKSVQGFGLKAEAPIAVKVNMQGQLAWRFLASLIDIVLPRVKEWPGVKGTSGDSSGNFSLGLTPEGVALFPEVEVNYDMYPPKLIPGMHITIHTSANNDKDGRKLLQAFGLPFYGKMRRA